MCATFEAHWAFERVTFLVALNSRRTVCQTVCRSSNAVGNDVQAWITTDMRETFC